MQNPAGASNSGAIIGSVVVIVLIALGVWYYTGKHGGTPQAPTPGTPVSGQLQGTVR